MAFAMEASLCRWQCQRGASGSMVRQCHNSGAESYLESEARPLARTCAQLIVDALTDGESYFGGCARQVTLV